MGEGFARRDFLQQSWNLALVFGGVSLASDALAVRLPFANGERPLVAYPEKRPLVRHTTRPPQLETPFAVFNEGVITPNDAFFVRYHLANIPTAIDEANYKLSIEGHVAGNLQLSLAELRDHPDVTEIVAVNQCSGNSRGFSKPRVGGGQLGHGAMGNARWRGVPLRSLLRKANIKAGAKEVTFAGLDTPASPKTPAFIKALSLEQALSDEVLVAFAMNGEHLPLLNGYPLRLVVPGYFGTYWVKHLAKIEVINTTFDGFFMAKAYRIPKTPNACIVPGTLPKATIPIGRFAVRSFITSLQTNVATKSQEPLFVRGIAFDGGSGIERVDLSVDGGRTWVRTELGEDLGPYSFRSWHKTVRLPKPGNYELLSRATSRAGERQPLEPCWNPSGYLRNSVERVGVLAV